MLGSCIVAAENLKQELDAKYPPKETEQSSQPKQDDSDTVSSDRVSSSGLAESTSESLTMPPLSDDDQSEEEMFSTKKRTTSVTSSSERNFESGPVESPSVPPHIEAPKQPKTKDSPAEENDKLQPPPQTTPPDSTPSFQTASKHRPPIFQLSDLKNKDPTKATVADYKKILHPNDPLKNEKIEILDALIKTQRTLGGKLVNKDMRDKYKAVSNSFNQIWASAVCNAKEAGDLKGIMSAILMTDETNMPERSIFKRQNFAETNTTKTQLTKTFVDIEKKMNDRFVLTPSDPIDARSNK